MDWASMAYRVILRICSSENGLSVLLLKASITLSKLMPLSELMPLCWLSLSAADALNGNAMLIFLASMALTRESSEA